MTIATHMKSSRDIRAHRHNVNRQGVVTQKKILDAQGVASPPNSPQRRTHNTRLSREEDVAASLARPGSTSNDINRQILLAWGGQSQRQWVTISSLELQTMQVTEATMPRRICKVYTGKTLCQASQTRTTHLRGIFNFQMQVHPPRAKA